MECVTAAAATGATKHCTSYKSNSNDPVGYSCTVCKAGYSMSQVQNAAGEVQPEQTTCETALTADAIPYKNYCAQYFVKDGVFTCEECFKTYGTDPIITIADMKDKTGKKRC